MQSSSLGLSVDPSSPKEPKKIRDIPICRKRAVHLCEKFCKGDRRVDGFESFEEGGLLDRGD